MAAAVLYLALDAALVILAQVRQPGQDNGGAGPPTPLLKCAAQSRCQSERWQDIRDGSLATLLQPVIWVRCANPIGAMMESFRGRPVLTGLVRRANSPTTGIGPMVSWLHRA